MFLFLFSRERGYLMKIRLAMLYITFGLINVILHDNDFIFQYDLHLSWYFQVLFAGVWYVSIVLIKRGIVLVLGKVFLSPPVYLWVPVQFSVITLVMVILEYILPFFEVSFFGAALFGVMSCVLLLIQIFSIKEAELELDRDLYGVPNHIGNSLNRSY